MLCISTKQEMMDPEMIGAIKIKDGLFVGDEFAAQELEFVVANKVTRIINCAAAQVRNHWDAIGVKYLTYFWTDGDSQILCDSKDQMAKETFGFIEESLQKGESALVHSVRGQNRACTVLAAYLMQKYKWSLAKSLEFLKSRRPGLEIRASFLQQLTGLESRLVAAGVGPKTYDWMEVHDQAEYHTNEELLLRNTYLNARPGPRADFTVPSAAPKPSRICWADTSKKGSLATAIISQADHDSASKRRVQRTPILLDNITSEKVCSESDSIPLNKGSVSERDKNQLVIPPEILHSPQSQNFSVPQSQPEASAQTDRPSEPRGCFSTLNNVTPETEPTCTKEYVDRELGSSSRDNKSQQAHSLNNPGDIQIGVLHTENHCPSPKFSAKLQEESKNTKKMEVIESASLPSYDFSQQKEVNLVSEKEKNSHMIIKLEKGLDKFGTPIKKIAVIKRGRPQRSASLTNSRILNNKGENIKKENMSTDKTRDLSVVKSRQSEKNDQFSSVPIKERKECKNSHMVTSESSNSMPSHIGTAKRGTIIKSIRGHSKMNPDILTKYRIKILLPL